MIETAGELEPAAHDHVLELDVRPAPALGSRDDLQRVATNLIENALRHTPPGTRVTVSTRTLPDGTAELVVADDGPGIAPAMRDTLFDRFVRGAGDRGGSFGLGLAIVAAVVHAHGGTVTADAVPPRRRPLHRPPPAAAETPAPGTPAGDRLSSAAVLGPAAPDLRSSLRTVVEAHDRGSAPSAAPARQPRARQAHA